jgi:hypothetical protein
MRCEDPACEEDHCDECGNCVDGDKAATSDVCFDCWQSLRDEHKKALQAYDNEVIGRRAEVQRCHAEMLTLRTENARLSADNERVAQELLGRLGRMSCACEHCDEARKVVEAVKAWFALASSPRIPSAIRALLAPKEGT